MSNYENPNSRETNHTDLVLIIIFALGIATWVCYFLSISGAGF